MKVLLKIGHTTFLLPNDAGVSAVMKTFSKALHCYDRTYEQSTPHLKVDPEPLEISMRFVDPKTVIRTKLDESTLLENGGR